MAILESTMEESTLEIELKDRAFNPYRIPKSVKASSVVQEIIGQLLSYEQYFGLRKRNRNAKDAQTFQRIATAILCDLIHLHLTSPSKLIYIPLSKRVLGNKGRYVSPLLSKTIPDILEVLVTKELDFVHLIKGTQGFERSGNKRTTIACSPRLIERIERASLTLSDLAEDCTQETIILKSSKEGHFDNSQWVNYKDDETTNRYRSDLYVINTWLAKADIVSELNVDISNRLLRRYFSNGSFKSGGRLFGGFWQSMSKAQRKDNLYINEQSITTLDYSQATPKLAYGLAEASPPQGDAYTLPSSKYDRKVVKQIFSAMIYADHPLTRFPKGTRESFERQVRFGDISKAIHDYHQPISHLFGKGIGLQLMYQESEILIYVLKECMSKDIVALPVHDALIIAESDKARVESIMLEAFQTIGKVAGKIVEE